MSATLLVKKVPLEVPQECGTALLTVAMLFLATFFKKGRSPLDPESSRTLIVRFWTLRPWLGPFLGPSARSGRCLAPRYPFLVLKRSYLALEMPFLALILASFFNLCANLPFLATNSPFFGAK